MSVTSPEPALPRRRPCPSCPYRCDVPSGIWAAEEYAKLPAYDGDVGEQVMTDTAWVPFFCHQADGRLCSGWLAHRDPADLLAVRLGIGTGALDPAVLDYRTDVPLFVSGAAAAAHGVTDLAQPSDAARATSAKIMRRRALTDQPITTEPEEGT